MKKTIALLWLFTLMIPAYILLYNLVVFLLENDFVIWHTTILIGLLFPITTTILFMKEETK